MTHDKSLREAEATVKKNESGEYYDLSKNSLVQEGCKHLRKEDMDKLFATLRLRFSMTPACNLWCVFCSNEGSSYAAKSEKFADVDQVIKLSKMLLDNTPLKSIDFSGGEPLIHPDFKDGNFKLVEFVKQYPDARFSLHTNGINLTKTIVDKIKDHFSRIGISVHSFNFETWNKITNLKGLFPVEAQKEKFAKVMANLEYLGQQNIGHKVFIKSVIMRGVNDSEDELKGILDFCDKHNFHPKFLEFEPQYPEQRKYIVGRKEFFEKLEKIGCHFSADVPRHNDPDTYIPGVNFSYYGKNETFGLHSIFGCGLKGACESCYSFLCMFVKPDQNGKGLYLKPCSVLDTRIDLSHALETNNAQQLLDLFKLSREYLMLSPGLASCGWNREEDYKFE
ncbi:MAG: radical SAM protein [Candidatus Falkowbacteria bacterium]|nr:radical SAM protein [Candidatus Falkowbacteria bacterium]